jgi:DNA invertase Pin-like site-specific DNA recombinase
MKQKEFVSYYRVSTQRQGTSGLGLAAQRHAVQNFLHGGQHKEIAQFSEVESRKRTDRPKLNKALELCRKSKATLVIGTLDRLAGDAAFVLSLKSSGVEFTCADAPFADRFTIGILALVAERDRERIAQRTKDALAAAKRRGVKLGNPKLLNEVRPAAIAANQARAKAFAATLAPVIAGIRKAGVTTLRGIAECLNARGFKTPAGKAFTRQAVANVTCRS